MKPVRKAVIPAAGFGTRLYPATKVVKKELFPLVDRDGLAKPFIHIIVQEAVDAGIEQVALILQPEDVPTFQNYFQTDLPPDQREKVSVRPWAEAQTQAIRTLGQHLVFLVQESQEGFGHAVVCAREWVEDEPFLLMLGDHAYISSTETNCAAQLLEAFRRADRSCVGVDRTPASHVNLYGTVGAMPVGQIPGEYEVQRYVEKPEADYARQNLKVPGLPEDTFLCLFGLYVLLPSIFECLAVLIDQNANAKAEVQFTDALEMLRDREGGHRAVEIHGARYDVGVPEQYLATLLAFAGLDAKRREE